MGHQTVRPRFFNWGPAEIQWGDHVLGATKGGVTVTITTNWINITVDAYGTTPLDAFEQGTEITVLCRLAESDLLENMEAALPAGDRKSDPAGGARAEWLTFGRTAGVTTPTKKRLVVKPVETNGRWLTIYQAAATTEALTMEFNNEDIRVIEVTFTGFIMVSRDDGDRLFRIGGPAS